MDEETFLLEDYKMKVDFFTKHFSRVWMRLNFFLVIQSGLIVFGGKMILENNHHNSEFYTIYFIANLILCVFWYLFGAQDRFLTTLYRSQAHISGGLCAKKLKLYKYEPVGNTKLSGSQSKPQNSLIQWRSELFSMTKLPAILPLIFIILWMVTYTIHLNTGPTHKNSIIPDATVSKGSINNIEYRKYNLFCESGLGSSLLSNTENSKNNEKP